MPTLAEKQKQIFDQLTAAGIEDAMLDARLLMQHALRLDQAEQFSQAQRLLAPEEARKVDQLVQRRAAREPIARITGEREFWSLSFGLNEATLEPRPDSETLVEIASKALRNQNAPRLLDLGTGSGCLLLSVLHECPTATGLGVDIAPRAVEQAQKNAGHLGLAGRAAFRVGNWLENIDECFDLILANPPYIPSVGIDGLMPEVRHHDPLRALDGGEDGLNPYRLLIPQMPRFLKPKGMAVFEVGQGQAREVAALCEPYQCMHAAVYKDFAGVERCITVRFDG